MWIKALEKAATGEVGAVTINFDDFFVALGMERDSSYTLTELNKCYRKAALKNHPDKGGDVEAVRVLQDIILYRVSHPHSLPLVIVFNTPSILFLKHFYNLKVQAHPSVI